MRPRIAIACALSCVLLVPMLADESQPATPSPSPRTAAQKALAVIQTSQKIWIKKEKCFSCHHQLLPAMAFKLARERGVAFDEGGYRESTVAAFSYLKDVDLAVQMNDYIDVPSDAFALVAANDAGIAPNLSTALYAGLVASLQNKDGSWPAFDARVPAMESPFTMAALCVRAIDLYTPRRFESETKERIRRAREWFRSRAVSSTEDQVFRLLGLKWASGNEEELRRFADQLLKEQRTDGGWAQIPALRSDAYATGQTLYALHDAGGLSTDHAAYQKGVRFLLDSQLPDGSWFVKTRLHPPAPVSPPYFETGFPHKKDQFISCYATAWAALALSSCVEAAAGVRRELAPPLDVAPVTEPWMETALVGTVSELSALLDKGLNPSSKTPAGTTLLMAAALDVEKVRLLIDRGADVNARAATGYTALMVAALRGGTTDIVRLLLEKGAQVGHEPGVKIRYDASPLFLAAVSGETEKIDLLLSRGGKVSEVMSVLGLIPMSPVLYATSRGELKMIRHFLAKGAGVNEKDSAGINLIGWAVINHRLETARELLKAGADLQNMDKLKMTPLLYAATVDFGDTALLELLLKSGADTGARTEEGKTALGQARKHGHADMARVLEQAGLKE